jgi:signal transduction histidine kinase
MRTASAAAGVVGLALLIAGVSLVFLVRRSITLDVRAAATLRAAQIAEVVGTAGLPGEIEAGDREEEFVQVVEADGTVVFSSANVAGRAALARPGPDAAVHLPRVPFEDGPFLAVAASGGDGSTVIVGRSLEPVAETTGIVAWSLAAGIPLLVLVIGTVAWRLVGRALAPVEAIRAEVEAISSRELHRRVPEPSGEDELARLAHTMNRMLGRLEDAQTTQRRFVSDASHELRSPIASIRQHAEVAMVHPTTANASELAEVVSYEVLRLQRIVDDLLLLSRIDEGTLAMSTTNVDLADLVAAEAARLRAATQLEVRTDIEPAGVSGNAEQLDRLLRNLTDNAVRHANARIALSLHAADGVVSLAVDDDGASIPEDERTRVFGRFVRLDEARDRDSGGSGLGLAIVREIATAHGATATASRSPLGGARFEVIFPRERHIGARR